VTVLIVTSESRHDPCVPLVARALEARGGAVVVLDLDRFPTELPLSLGIGAERGRIGATPLAEITAAWIRNFDVAAGLPDDMRDDHRRAARVESRSAFWALLQCLDGFLLDPPAALLGAPAKPRQLELARAVGLDVPATLLTNDPDAVRAFAAGCAAGLVCKMVDSKVGFDSAGDWQPVFTRTVDADDLADLDGLRLCPMLFQERVPKARELRVSIVGRRLFTAAVEATGADPHVDWRATPGQVSGFRPAELPDDVAQRIHQLMDRVGLNFGAIDLIETPDHRHVFLELNTISYFDFVEQHAGLPIAAAVAELLLGHAPRRTGPAR
jgi:glutathione synthase/RimK-type ligase-like ATP-grasp enzyme